VYEERVNVVGGGGCVGGRERSGVAVSGGGAVTVSVGRGIRVEVEVAASVEVGSAFGSRVDRIKGRL
jgi:hypothetical protein